jgi:hypothetical protein
MKSGGAHLPPTPVQQQGQTGVYASNANGPTGGYLNYKHAKLPPTPQAMQAMQAMSLTQSTGQLYMPSFQSGMFHNYTITHAHSAFCD